MTDITDPTALLRETAQHIRSDQFATAIDLAVADLLDREADHLQHHISAWTEPPAVAHDNPQRLAQLVEHNYGHVLAVARAYGGGQ